MLDFALDYIMLYSIEGFFEVNIDTKYVISFIYWFIYVIYYFG